VLCCCAEGGSDVLVVHFDAALLGMWSSRIAGNLDELASSGISATGSD
jgi:hypothetical protein